MAAALGHVRVCDFTGQLAGAGATRFLAGFGAEVIRIEDPVNQGRWDILRGNPPYVDQRSGIDLGGAFNNHNVEKLGITLNLRNHRAKRVLEDLISTSDVLAENFAAGVLARWGFGYERLRAIRPDIIYVSNCGFGHSGPWSHFKTWGPTVQALSGLTFQSGLPDQPPAGWGYSYMDHTGAYYMAIAMLMALHHRELTGEGQWIDYATTEAAMTLNGPVLLDYTVNGRPLRRPGLPDSNHSQWPRMAPHYIYPARDQDSWLAIACRDDGDWRAFGGVVGEDWCRDERFATLERRLEHEVELDECLSAWTRTRDPRATATSLQAAGVPASAVQTPEQRVDEDANTAAWGLWPEVQHTQMGRVRVDGLPVHLSKTDWRFERGAPCLGEHTVRVLTELLGLSEQAVSNLREDGAL
jgi:benzylsuccinate CoA-transferase BbsF subunit